MISLERAFIKAYQRQSGAAGGVPRPHFDTGSFRAPSTAPQHAATSAGPQESPRGEATWHDRNEPTAPPDLSPAPAPPPRETSPAERNEATGLRPVFEVARLQWPRHCISLLKQAEGQLGEVADQLQALLPLGEKLICFASLRRGEGRTSTLLCLARLLSSEGRKIALVDADLKQPQLGRQLGLLPQAGWENVLLDRLPLEEALIEAVDDRATLLPARGPWTEPLSPELYRPMSEAVRRLRDEHELVLMDVGPLETSGTEELLAALHCDAAVLVRDLRSTSVAELESATMRLAAAGIKRWQVAENFAPAAA